MSGEHSFRLYPAMRFASRVARDAGCGQRTPRQNHLLATLPPEDYERLLPDLEPVRLPLGWTIYGSAAREEFLYFLTAGIVSRVCATQNGALAEFAVTGREGVIGIASFLGGESTPSRAVVLSAGYGYRLEADVLKNEFEHGGLLPQLLLTYTQALIAQTGQIAACNRHHTVKQRMCRWILSCVDRLPTNELTMTHELIADMLGVRRVSVTHVVGELQTAGLIHCRRGHVAVLDRRGLEARACECYAAIEGEYDRLLHLEDPHSDAGVRTTRRRYRQVGDERAYATPNWRGALAGPPFDA